MSTKAAKKTASPPKAAKRAKAANGHSNGHVNGLDVGPPVRVTLPRSDQKNVQQTFRVTIAESNYLTEEASTAGFSSMGRYIRYKLGLEEPLPLALTNAQQAAAARND